MLRTVVCRFAALTVLVVAPALAQESVAASSSIDATTFAPTLAIDLSRVERLTATLYRRDLVAGTGEQLRLGATATFLIRTVRADGTPISVANAPLTTEWRSGLFTRSVERGIDGMRVGGRRQLIVGPGAGGGLPADAVVVVEVELLAAK